MFLTNNRVTFVELPSGVQLQPGMTMQVDEEQAEKLQKHPCMGLWLRHGVLTLSNDEGMKVAQEPTSDERQASARMALQKETKLARIRNESSADMLAAMAKDEKDPEVIKAINERLTAMTENGAPLKINL